MLCLPASLISHLCLFVVKVMITVRDRYGDYRGCIAKDGQCFNNTGHTTG